LQAGVKRPAGGSLRSYDDGPDKQMGYYDITSMTLITMQEARP
jgi:hypothetical protein